MHTVVSDAVPVLVAALVHKPTFYSVPIVFGIRVDDNHWCSRVFIPMLPQLVRRYFRFIHLKDGANHTQFVTPLTAARGSLTAATTAGACTLLALFIPDARHGRPPPQCYGGHFAGLLVCVLVAKRAEADQRKHARPPTQ